jgi:SEC-C motif-containing protein
MSTVESDIVSPPNAYRITQADSPMPRLPRQCPCHSGLRYTACCASFHRGEREPPTPEALMRSRYAAFSLGLGEYLVETLAQEHPDRALPRDGLVLALSRSRQRQRFLDLQILHASADGDQGEVLFYARIFEQGEDRSFVELSSFGRESSVWRYVSGLLVPAERLPKDVSLIDRCAFLELAGHLPRSSTQSRLPA